MLAAMRKVYIIFCIITCFLFQSCDGLKPGKVSDRNKEEKDSLCEMIADGYRMVQCACADSAYLYFETARIQAESADKPDSMALGRIYNGFGLYYTELMADLSSGFDAFSTACKYVDGMPESEGELGRYLVNIAVAYSIGNDGGAGLEYAEEAYRKGLELDDSLILYNSALVIAEQKLKLKDAVEGRQYIDIARRYQKGIGSNSQIMMLIVEGLANELDGDCKEAEAKYTLAADISEAPVFLRQKSLLLLASLKSRNGMSKEAVDVLNQGLRIAGRKKVRTYLPEIFTDLAECHMRLGHHNAALNLMLYYKTYSDSTQTLMQKTAMQRLRLNNEIMLNKFTIERQRGYIQKKERDIVIMLSCVGLLVIVLAFTLVLFYKKRCMYRVIVRQNRDYAKHEEYLNQAIANLQSQVLACTHDKQINGNSMSALKIEDIMARLAVLLADDLIISDNSLTLNSIAEMLDTNRTYLSKAIKETTGDSFPSLVKSFRVKRAIRIMEQNADVSLVEVYKKSGFTSRSSFYSAFKDEVGMSPSVYKSLLHKK